MGLGRNLDRVKRCFRIVEEAGMVVDKGYGKIKFLVWMTDEGNARKEKMKIEHKQHNAFNILLMGSRVRDAVFA